MLMKILVYYRLMGIANKFFSRSYIENEGKWKCTHYELTYLCQEQLIEIVNRKWVILSHSKDIRMLWGCRKLIYILCPVQHLVVMMIRPSCLYVWDQSRAYTLLMMCAKRVYERLEAWFFLFQYLLELLLNSYVRLPV